MRIVLNITNNNRVIFNFFENLSTKETSLKDCKLNLRHSIKLQKKSFRKKTFYELRFSFYLKCISNNKLVIEK